MYNRKKFNSYTLKLNKFQHFIAFVTISRGESEKGLSASILIYFLIPFSFSPLDMNSQIMGPIF